MDKPLILGLSSVPLEIPYGPMLERRPTLKKLCTGGGIKRDIGLLNTEVAPTILSLFKVGPPGYLRGRAVIPN